MSQDIIRAALARAKDHPEDFVRYFLQTEPDEWQLEALRAIKEHRRTSIRSGHGVGKSAVDAWVIMWVVLTHRPCTVVVIGPSHDQVNKALWREVGIWVGRLPQPLQDELEYTGDYLRLKSAPQECMAMVRVANKENPIALQGVHGPNVYIIFDEASGVDDIVFEKMKGAQTGEAPKEILTGNPNLTTGYFYDTHNRLSSRYHRIHVPVTRSPRVTQEWIDNMREEYGEHSNTYRVMVEGEFPNADDNTLIPRDVIVRAVGREVSQTAAPVVWGVDPAGPGEDRSALAKRKGNVLLEPVKYWQGYDTQQLAGQIILEYNRTPEGLRPTQILVDVIGIGAGVHDRLREEQYPVVGVNVAERPATSPDRFMLLRDELWWRGKEWFEALDCQIPNQPQLIHELANVQYRPHGSGKIKLEPKYETRRRLRLSPDLADAFILTLHNQTAFGKKQASKPVDTSWIR